MTTRCTLMYRVRLLAALLLVVPGAAAAQGGEPYRIQGSVVGSNTLAPVVGVQISLRGTNLGTLSGSDGQYVISARLPAGTYTLEFAYLGRRTTTLEVLLADEQTVNVPQVELEETAVELDQIVVTAPGVAVERRAVASAVATVSGEAINRAPGVASVDQALQGKITGATITETSGQPGGGVTIRLRGPSSILGTAEPLIVIDGVISDNDTEALIGLSANADGGGRSGSALTNRLADISPSEIERVEVLKGAAAAALYGSRAKNGVIQIFTRRGRQGAPTITLTSDFEVNTTPDRFDLVTTPLASRADVTYGFAPSYGAPVERIDYQDEIFRTGLGASTNFSVAGGSEGTSYFISGTYQTEDGITRGSDHRKTSARAKVTQQLSPKIELTANGNFIQSETSFVPEGEQTVGVLTALVFTPPAWDPSFDADLGRYPYNPVLGPNPFDIIENWQAQEEVTRFVGGVEANFRPLDNLTIRYLFGIDDYRLENKFFQPPQSIANFTGLVQNPVRLSRQLNHDLIGTHDLAFGEGTGFTTTLGLRATRDREEVVRAASRDLPPQSDLITGATQLASQSIVEINTLGGFLQGQLSLLDRIFLTGGTNIEASSAFGEDERWQLFPRLGVSYLIHEEPWWQESAMGGVFSTLRLRAAYGETGGQPPGAYSRFDNYVTVGYAGKAGLIPSSIDGNPNLEPERQREIEGGFEAGFFDDRALVEFTYYSQRTFDLILNVPQPLSRGLALRPENIGELTNKGYELAVNTVNINRDDFSWRSRLSLGGYKNEVTRLVTAADTLTFGYLNAVIEGQPLGVFYGGQYARDAEGNIRYIRVASPIAGEGVPDSVMLPMRASLNDDNAAPYINGIIGDPNPDLIASLSNTFTLGRNLELNVLLDGRFGNDVANFTRRITEFFGASERVGEELRGDTIPFTYAFNPAGRINIYEEYIEDGSFVKLREIALRYRFDQPWVQRLGAASFDVRIAGRNLYTWTDFTGLDPEVNLFAASPVAQGVEFANTPLPRSLTVGFSLVF